MPVYVIKDKLNPTLDRFGATLHLDVENSLHREHAPLQLAIRVTDLSDLSPAGVVAHVPRAHGNFTVQRAHIESVAPGNFKRRIHCGLVRL